MKSKNESKNHKKRAYASQFIRNMGRLKRLQPNKRKEIARKGGLAKSMKKRLSSQMNAIKTGRAIKSFNISLCNNCHVKANCSDYEQDSVCKKELTIRKNVLKQLRMVDGNNPESMLLKMMLIFLDMERMTQENPSFVKYSKLFYLLIELYKLKFGEGNFNNIKTNVNENSLSKEIKQLMEKVRIQNMEVEKDD